MKRYRLKIPTTIKKEDCFKACNCYGKRDKIIEDTGVWSQDGNMFFGMDYIPKDWLEEIKDEPDSAENWVRQNKEQYVKGTIMLGPQINDQYAIAAYKAGAAENELRHKPKQSFSEIFGVFKAEFNLDHIKYFVNLWDKNRGFDE